MKNLLAAAVASTLVLSTAGYAADAYKREDLTKEQRTEMRARADMLIANRAAHPAAAKTEMQSTSRIKKHPVKKSL